MDKEYVVYIENGIFLSHKKKWNLAIWDNMDGPAEYYAKWNVRQKYGITYMWNLKEKQIK